MKSLWIRCERISYNYIKKYQLTKTCSDINIAKCRLNYKDEMVNICLDYNATMQSAMIVMLDFTRSFQCYHVLTTYTGAQRGLEWVLLECNYVNVVVGSVYGNGGDENWSEWASTVNNELNEELDSPDEQRRQQPDRWTDECSHSMNGWNFNCNFAVNVLMKYNTNFFILLWLLLLNCRCCC